MQWKLQDNGMTTNGSLPLRKSKSTRFNDSLSTKSLSFNSRILWVLNYKYSTEKDERLEMIANAGTRNIGPPTQGFFFRLLKLNTPEWPYALLGTIGSVFSGLIGPMFSIIMRNMFEVFYSIDKKHMQRKTKEYVFIYIRSGFYVVVSYLCQCYFFSIMGKNLIARLLSGKLVSIQNC